MIQARRGFAPLPNHLRALVTTHDPVSDQPILVPMSLPSPKSVSTSSSSSSLHSSSRSARRRASSKSSLILTSSSSHHHQIDGRQRISIVRPSSPPQPSPPRSPRSYSDHHHASSTSSLIANAVVARASPILSTQSSTATINGVPLLTLPTSFSGTLQPSITSLSLPSSTTAPSELVTIPLLSLHDAHQISINEIEPIQSIGEAASSSYKISSQLRERLIHADIQLHGELQPPFSSSLSSSSVLSSSALPSPRHMSTNNGAMSSPRSSSASTLLTMIGNHEASILDRSPLVVVRERPNEMLDGTTHHDSDNENDIDDEDNDMLTSMHAGGNSNMGKASTTNSMIAQQNVDASPFTRTSSISGRKANKAELDRAERVQWLSLRGKAPRHNLTVAERQRCKEMFSMLDLDQSNSIDVDELRRAMLSFGMRVPREDLMQTIALYDADRNGELTFDEFVQGYFAGATWDGLFTVAARRKRAEMIRQQRNKQYHQQRLRSLRTLHSNSNTKSNTSSTTLENIPQEEKNDHGDNHGSHRTQDIKEFKEIDAVAPMSHDDIEKMFAQVGALLFLSSLSAMQ
jgi:Ca2+-binding EF-hand superfamily protein